MIYKAHVDDIEYRVDVTMREDTLEYDVVLLNLGSTTKEVQAGLAIRLTDEAKKEGYKVTAKGYIHVSEDAVSTDKITLPVGQFIETPFYMKISK
jgi:hypothetical protein